MLTLVEEYARGITIDTSALEEAVGRIDPKNLAELSSQLEGGLFEPQKTPEQLATLERLETMLALVEGWVDDVVSQATAPWMPAAAALAETVRRARATGGPAEATFATLVGLELRPRRMRDAANLWAALRDARGADGRTRSGATRTCCRPRPTWTTRWASWPARARRHQRRRLRRGPGCAAGLRR